MNPRSGARKMPTTNKKLINCPSCNHGVSKKAKNCPSCGAPIKQPIGIGKLIKWTFLIIFGISVYQCAGTSTNNTTETTKPTIKDDGNQAKRETFIQSLKDQNIIYKIDIPGSLPHVHVNQSFHSLTYDDKSQFISVICKYYAIQDPSIDMIVLYNSKTGKKIGTVHPHACGEHR